MTGEPRVADLDQLIESLRGSAAHPQLRKWFRKAAIAQSCVADLAQAEDCCVAIECVLASPRRQGSLERNAIEHSLIVSAVFLYSRATLSTGQYRERGGVQIVARLTPEQKVDHDKLTGLRNRALAHVYPNEPVADVLWHRSAGVLVEQTDGWLPSLTSIRVQIDKSTMATLQRQLPVARALITATFHEHLGRMTKLLNSMPVSIEAILGCQVDPSEIFGGMEGWRRALAAADPGGGLSFIR